MAGFLNKLSIRQMGSLGYRRGSLFKCSQIQGRTLSTKLQKSALFETKFVTRNTPKRFQHTDLNNLRPTDFEKRILVWTKFYPSVEKVPEIVPFAKVRKARDLFRIRVNMSIGAVTVVACIIVVIIGRRGRERGESLERELIARQNALQEEGRREREAAAREAQQRQV